MKRKSPSKARQKPVKSPLSPSRVSPSEPVKADLSLTSSGGEENVSFSEQDKNLDQLLKDIETPKDPHQGGASGDQPAASPSNPPEIDPEIYRDLGVIGSHFIASGIRLAVRPIRKDFLPLKPDQVEKVQPSTSKLIKKLIDWAWPQLLEKHGEETIAVMAWGSVIIQNLKDQEPTKAEKQAEPARQPVRGIVQPEERPSVDAPPPVSTVEVIQ